MVEFGCLTSGLLPLSLPPLGESSLFKGAPIQSGVIWDNFALFTSAEAAAHPVLDNKRPFFLAAVVTVSIISDRVLPRSHLPAPSGIPTVNRKHRHRCSPAPDRGNPQV